jgi:hypothetical protein
MCRTSEREFSADVQFVKNQEQRNGISAAGQGHEDARARRRQMLMLKRAENPRGEGRHCNW